MPTKTKRPLYKTPSGEVKFAWIVTPNTNHKEAGEFSIDLLLNPEDDGVAELKAMLDAEVQKALTNAIAAEPKKAAAIKKYTLTSPLKVDVDRETAEPTGKLLFRASEDATWTDRKTNESKDRTIDILNAKLNKLVKPKVGRGSIAKVAFTLNGYCVHGLQRVGVKAYLKAVQILKLEEYGGGTYGFGAEEGYEGESADVPAAENDSNTENAGKPAGDF